MEKLILEPVKVPWKLSASDEIEIFRSDSGTVELLLIADLINEQSKRPEIDIYDAIDIVQICLRFQHVQYFEFSRPWMERFDLDPQKYELPPIDLGDRDRFFRTWFSEQICPYPNMFQVRNSDVKGRLGISDDTMSHWLLTGHDELVSVIAKSFSWNVVAHLQ
ncbi:hypothetical protein D7V91_10515 [bacterium 1xD42-67]|nr:hypothetical protein D7V91_10515 [bacterium 1xD42-67]